MKFCTGCKFATFGFCGSKPLGSKIGVGIKLGEGASAGGACDCEGGGGGWSEFIF